MLDIRMKNKHLRQLEDYRYSLFKEPQLRNLFLNSHFAAMSIVSIAEAGAVM